MTYAIEWEYVANDELENIVTYLRQFYPGTPGRFSVALQERLRDLQEMPYMYPVYQDNPAYRKMVVLKYVVFYKVNDAERTIKVCHILPGSWDLSRHLLQVNFS
jgi:plasmid stabilization system protein ParE